jgi:hypothetical protein
VVLNVTLLLALSLEIAMTVQREEEVPLPGPEEEMAALEVAKLTSMDMMHSTAKAACLEGC